MEPSRRVLTLAIGASVLLHAVVLSIQFKLPDAIRRMATPATLEVVLVNAKTRSRPVKPDVMAQANVDGGGNTDQDRRAKSRSPVTNSNQSGDDIQQAARRVQQLEAQQRELLSRVQPDPAPAPVTPKAPEPEPSPPPVISGRDLVARSMEMIKLEAQIARRTDAYNKRPRKEFVGVRAREFRFAHYSDAWVRKVERIGNLNYPETARGKIYGDVQMSVGIRSDGSIDSIEVLRSSGYSVLDQAAERSVRMGEPYAVFPPDIRRDIDILVITRTWHFTQGDRLFGD